MRVNDISMNFYKNVNSFKKPSNVLQSYFNQKMDRLDTIDNLKFQKLRAGIRMSYSYQSNIQDGVALIETMRSSLSSARDLSDKLKELAIAYENDTLTDSQREQYQKDAKALMDEIKSIFDSASYNGQKIFKKPNYSILTGDNQYINIKTPNIDSILGLNKPDKNTDENQKLLGNQRSIALTAYRSGANLMSTNKISDDNLATAVTNSQDARSGNVPHFTVPPAKLNLPDQGNYTGYKRIYNDNGTLLYEGTLKNGKLNGNGRLYDENGKLLYDGDWKNGKFDNWGTLYGENGEKKYYGGFDNGVLTGWGEFYGDNGKVIYEGWLKEGYREGWGTTYDNDGNCIESKHYQDYTLHGKGDNGSGDGNGNGGNNGDGDGTGDSGGDGTGDSGGDGSGDGNGNGGNNGDGDGTGGSGGNGDGDGNGGGNDDNNGDGNGNGNGGNNGDNNGNGNGDGTGDGGDSDNDNNKPPTWDTPDYLDKDFIEENIDKVIDNADSALGVQGYILESRLRYQFNVQSIMEDREDKMIDSEIIRVMKEQAKQEMLSSVQQTLMMQEFESRRQFIAKLLG